MGRLVRTVVTREPEWDDEARAWILALAVREAAECGRCGGNLVDTTDYDAWTWEPQPPVVCLRCVALHESVKAHEKNPQSHGMIHQVHRRPRPPRKKRRTRR